MSVELSRILTGVEMLQILGVSVVMLEILTGVEMLQVLTSICSCDNKTVMSLKPLALARLKSFAGTSDVKVLYCVSRDVTSIRL